MPEKSPYETYKPNRKANGMLLSFPDAVMIADDTNGPINADVFPTYINVQVVVNIKPVDHDIHKNIPLKIVQRRGT